MHVLEKIINQGKRVFVFLGEAGSGKSEIAVNWALAFAAAGKTVRFFDMDQTKPLFRSRELAGIMKERRILVDDNRQFLDSPTIPNAVLDRVKDPDGIVILDIGGNVAGARAIGQFAEAWGQAVAAYLVINCFRPFSGSQTDMILTVDSIVAAARLEDVGVISSPNFGEQTTLEDVISGHNYLETFLRGTNYSIKLLVVKRQLEAKVKTVFPKVDVLGITRYIRTPWEIDENEGG